MRYNIIVVKSFWILYVWRMVPLNSEDKIHPNTWWQNEQLHISLQALPYDGRTHLSVQSFPKYPAGQSKISMHHYKKKTKKTPKQKTKKQQQYWN